MARDARSFFPLSYRPVLLFAVVFLILPAAVGQAEAFKAQDPAGAMWK